MNRTSGSRIRVLAAALALGFSLPAQAQQSLRIHPTRWRLTFEQVGMANEPALGLAGGHYDLLEPIPPFNPLFVGLGGYGALTGIRGGFFVLGVTAGVRAQPHPNFGIELGGFAGGGGGGSAAQGSGLMLRPYAAIEGIYAKTSLRLELARVLFPTGAIQSTHLSVGVTLPDALNLLGPPEADAEPGVLEAGPRMRLAASAATYFPSATSVRHGRGPHPGPMFLAGARLDRFVGNHFFVPLTAHGALGGEVGGYMDVFSGLGVSLPFSRAVGLDLLGYAGAGGGGAVNTGGGLLFHPSAALWLRLGQAHLQLSGGHLFAPQGRFGGWSGALLVGVQTERVEVSDPEARIIALGEDAGIGVDRWSVSFAHKTYFPASDRDNVQLLGAGLDRPLTEWLAVTGRGWAAWLGGVGGYAEGLLGVQLRVAPLPFAPNHQLRLDLQTGAAGGGGLEVASGLIAQATAQYRVAFARQFALSIGGGRMIALRGPFAATVLQAEFEWRLEFPIRLSP
jgi:hypothetical protein